MLLLRSISDSPAFNCALEEYLLTERPAGDVLLFYINRPSVIVGRNQRIEAEVDTGYCCEHGIEVVRRLGERFPILGVCLGHQAICEAYGARIAHAKRLMHGKSSVITADTSSALFRGLPQEMTVARYHSLAAVGDTMPDCLKVTARADDGEIMAVEHRRYLVFGLQFHPESILTPDGIRILENFIALGE